MEKVTGAGGVEVKVNLPKEKIEKINSICDAFGNDPGELINVLHEAQHAFGYIPAEIQDIVAHNLHMPVSQVYGVVTFYTFFSMTPKGEHPVSVCTGTACYVRGAERVLEEFRKELQLEVGETTPDGRFSLNCLRCVGACGLAPVVLVGEKVYGRVSPDGVKAIIEEYKK
ncbi:MAG: NAD(P)H-dependent oxidoreductase subunit E [Proteiniphilum sp.]|nr:NAD(P)H-dependent oxidoreductase subunit E [Proteiniphilum sp.]